MSEFKIDSDVPLPEKCSRSKLPLAKMLVGESVFVEARTSSSVQGSITHIKRTKGFMFTSRTVTENGVKGVRVWRVQ